VRTQGRGRILCPDYSQSSLNGNSITIATHLNGAKYYGKVQHQWQNVATLGDWYMTGRGGVAFLPPSFYKVLYIAQLFIYLFSVTTPSFLPSHVSIHKEKHLFYLSLYLVYSSVPTGAAPQSKANHSNYSPQSTNTLVGSCLHAIYTRYTTPPSLGLVRRAYIP